MFKNYDNTSMFPVNMNCVLSVNASVARTASVVYCLKMVQIEQHTLQYVVCLQYMLKSCVVQRLSGIA